MLHLLFYLLLQLGLLGGPSDNKKDMPAPPNVPEAEADGAIKAPILDVSTGGSIGGSGWDDKN